MYGYKEEDYEECDICGSLERDLNSYGGDDICGSCLSQQLYHGE